MQITEIRKNIKKNNILKIIRENSNFSRYDVKKATKYSMTTVLNSVNALIEENLLIEEESQEVKIGRTPQFLRINPDGKYFIGIEFNADVLNAVIINFAADIIYNNSCKLPKEATAKDVVKMVESAISNALHNVPDNDKLMGIGLGLPGYVDKESKMALEYSYIDKWNNIPIGQIIEDKFNTLVVMDNNINALTYQYKWDNRHKKNFLIVSMQFGTRLGIVLDNEIFIGSSGNAGEIGHTKVSGGTRLCSCGKVGCLDTEISHLAIEKKIMERISEGKLQYIDELLKLNDNKFSNKIFSQALHANDKDALELLDEIAKILGRKLSTVVSVLNIDDITVLNLNDMQNEIFANTIYETIKEYSLDSLTKNIDVKCKTVNPLSGAKGAALMVLNETYGMIKEQ